jgi:hypothetical protein
MYLDGPIIKDERSHKLHENLNNIPKLRYIWLPVDPPFVGRMCKVFQNENNSEFREGDRIIRIELSREVVHVLSLGH